MWQPIGRVYLVTMPDEYVAFMRAFSWLSKSLFTILVPNECITFGRGWLMWNNLTPLVVIFLVFAAHLASSCVRGDTLARGALASAGACLFVVFFLAPTVSNAIFQVWDFKAYELSPGQTRYFLRSALQIQRGSAEHNHNVAIASIFVAVWPVGSVMLFAALAMLVRRRLLAHSSDKLVRAIRFLHGQYKPEFCEPSFAPRRRAPSRDSVSPVARHCAPPAAHDDAFASCLDTIACSHPVPLARARLAQISGRRRS